MSTATQNTFLTYKGKPLVRSGNTIYYGSMQDPFVVMIQVQKSEHNDLLNLEMSQRVTIQLLSTDLDLRIRDRLIKKSEKDGLYNAIDLASIWLDRALKDASKSK